MKLLFTALTVIGIFARSAVAEDSYVKDLNQISKNSSIDLEGYSYSAPPFGFIQFESGGRVLAAIARDLPLRGTYLVNGFEVTITLHNQILILKASEDGCILADQNGLQFLKSATECHP